MEARADERWSECCADVALPCDQFSSHVWVRSTVRTVYLQYTRARIQYMKNSIRTHFYTLRDHELSALICHAEGHAKL